MDNYQITVSEATQDYLKAIYELTAETPSHRATTNQIAQRLQIKPASVTGMLRRLAEDNLIDYRKHQGARLFPAGLKIALRVIRHHRLIETFLHDKLGFGWDEVHEEAEHLEHVISPAVSQRMADVLGNPRHDPHGDPIPTRLLEMPPRITTRLVDLKAGESGTIVRVSDHDSSLLHLAGELGLWPGTAFVRIGAADIQIQLSGEENKQISVPAELAETIFIEKEGK